MSEAERDVAAGEMPGCFIVLQTNLENLNRHCKGQNFIYSSTITKHIRMDYKVFGPWVKSMFFAILNMMVLALKASTLHTSSAYMPSALK